MLAKSGNACLSVRSRSIDANRVRGNFAFSQALGFTRSRYYFEMGHALGGIGCAPGSGPAVVSDRRDGQLRPGVLGRLPASRDGAPDAVGRRVRGQHLSGDVDDADAPSQETQPVRGCEASPGRRDHRTLREAPATGPTVSAGHRRGRFPGVWAARRAPGTDLRAEQGTVQRHRSGAGDGEARDHAVGGRVPDDDVLLRLRVRHLGTEGATEAARQNGRDDPPRWPQPALTVLHDVQRHWQDPGQGRPRSSQHPLADLRPVLRPGAPQVPSTWRWIKHGIIAKPGTLALRHRKYDKAT